MSRDSAAQQRMLREAVLRWKRPQSPVKAKIDALVAEQNAQMLARTQRALGQMSSGLMVDESDVARLKAVAREARRMMERENAKQGSSATRFPLGPIRQADGVVFPCSSVDWANPAEQQWYSQNPGAFDNWLIDPATANDENGNVSHIQYKVVFHGRDRDASSSRDELLAVVSFPVTVPADGNYWLIERLPIGAVPATPPPGSPEWAAPWWWQETIVSGWPWGHVSVHLGANVYVQVTQVDANNTPVFVSGWIDTNRPIVDAQAYLDPGNLYVTSGPQEVSAAYALSAFGLRAGLTTWVQVIVDYFGQTAAWNGGNATGSEIDFYTGFDGPTVELGPQ
jgi:hypothetical protein